MQAAITIISQFLYLLVKLFLNSILKDGPIDFVGSFQLDSMSTSYNKHLTNLDFSTSIHGHLASYSDHKLKWEKKSNSVIKRYLLKDSEF